MRSRFLRKINPSHLTAVILAVSVVLPNAISMWADGRIKIHQEQISTLEIQRSNCLQLAAFHSDRVNAFEILEALSELAPRLGMKASVLEDKISKSDSEEKELFEQYKAERLTTAQYSQKMANKARQKRQYYANRVDQVNNEVLSLRNKPLRALSIKNFLPIVQTAGVILVVLINAPHLRKTRS